MKYGLIIVIGFFNFITSAQEPLNNHCWLARLPLDVQQIIGDYLSLNTKTYESIDHCQKRLQEEEAQIHYQNFIRLDPAWICIKKKDNGDLELHRDDNYLFPKKNLVTHHKTTPFGLLPKNDTNFFVISPQRNRTAALIDDNKVQVFSASSGKLKKKFALEKPKKVTGLAVSDNGHYVALADADSIWLKNLQNKEYKVIFDKRLQNFGITDKALFAKILKEKYEQKFEKGLIKTIGFNKQITKIAARFTVTHDEFEYFIFFDLNKMITENTLAAYFNKYGVCKNWPQTINQNDSH
jgi:hypothetical protein